WAPSPLRWARRETETTASIAGSAARAFAQPTPPPASRPTACFNRDYHSGAL
ncbi:MAG: hypothetical protein, partial [Olavius algarvensis Gamma 1 endosymbiont]